MTDMIINNANNGLSFFYDEEDRLKVEKSIIGKRLVAIECYHNRNSDPYMYLIFEDGTRIEIEATNGDFSAFISIGDPNQLTDINSYLENLKNE